MSKLETKTDRRTFMAGSEALIGAAVVPKAISYARILGANDRISLAHIGPGNRGQELDWIVAQHKTTDNVEITAICDLWNVRRDRAVQENTKYYGRAPRPYQYLEEVLALPDVDAVVISTPEHSHSPILRMAAEANKHAYVETPMWNVLAEAKQARNILKNSNLI